MNFEITTYDKPKTIVLGKMSEIKNEIVEVRSALQDAKDRCVRAQSNYDDVPGWRIFKKRKMEKEYQRAMNDLAIANSDAIIQNFKIMGYIIELILLCFCLPMDLMQKTVQWVASGFEERDTRFSSFVQKTIPLFEANKNRGKTGVNLSKGFFRILIVCISIILAILGIRKLVSHKKDVVVPIEPDITQVSETETIESLQEKIIELESSINALKENIVEPSITDEEINSNNTNQDTGIELNEELSEEEIEEQKIDQNETELIEQETVIEETETVEEIEDAEEIMKNNQENLNSDSAIEVSTESLEQTSYE